MTQKVDSQEPGNKKSTDGAALTAQPRIKDAEWTWARIWTRYRFAIVTVINLTIFFIIWQLLAHFEVIGPHLIFPTFTDTLRALKIGWLGGQADDGTSFELLRDFVIARNAWESLQRYAISMVIAIGIGIPIGLAMGGFKWVDAILSPYVWTLSSLPRLAIYAPLVMIMGIGESIKYALIILTAIFPVIINTWAGVKTTEQSLINAARVFGAGRAQIYKKVVLPYTLPFVVSGIQLSLSRGLIGVVIVEFLTGASTLGGLGWLIFRSASAFNSALTYASLMSLAVFALILVQGTRSMEAKIAPWRQVSKT
ncbi:MAG: ABC transporter permease [Acidimicrobiia bacterium]|nr:ABC transporter permease [Acidimicrobiia bacterium]